MRKQKILFLIFLFLSITVFSQQKTAKEHLYKGQSFHYTNKDSAYYYYNKAITQSKKENDKNVLLDSFLYLIHANGNNYDLVAYSKTIDAFQKAIDSLRNTKKIDNFPFYQKYLLVYQIDYYYNINNYQAANNAIQKLLNILDSIPNSNKIRSDYSLYSSAYSYQAIINVKKQKLNKAKEIYQKDLSFILKNKDSIVEWESGLNNSKKLLASVYSEKKEFDKADKLLQEALEFYKKRASNPRFKNNILSVFSSAAKNALKEKKYTKAIAFIDESKKYYQKENSFDKEFDLLNGDAFLGLKEYNKALNYYQKALEKTIKYRKEKKHQDIANVYAKIANVYFKKNQNIKALDFYQKALTQLDSNFVKMQYKFNPNPKTVSSKTQLISILKNKQNVLLHCFEQTKDLSNLINAHKTSFIIIETLDLLKPEFDNKLDKLFLINETYPSFQKMVEVSYVLYKKTKKERYIKDAFYFMEKSKAILLLEAQRNTEATKFGGIPEQILEKEQQFRAKIAFLEKKAYKKNTGDHYFEDLINTKSAYNKFILNLEKNYPKYYNLKYNATVTSVDEIQKQLSKNLCIVSYLATNNKLYAIILEKDYKHFLNLKYDSKIKFSIKELYQKSANLTIQDQDIYQKSNAVFQSILKPVLQKTKKTKLLIFPDDLLNYIPFDALITNVKTQEFLINNYSISYENSATLWKEHKAKKTQTKNKILAFAPKFNETYFANLQYNLEEVNRIKNYFKGSFLLKEQATLENFEKNAGKYNLIHLATHAIVNDNNPDYSYLVFSNSTKNNNLLYVKDLYNYHLNADLVTLSACETGIGKLQKGEGMLSLSRAFNYAGATSLVTTLWKIDDESTSTIIADFYKYLKKGLTKSDALREAKLNYLKNNENDKLLRHPYYWSGITISGNTEAVVKSNNYWIYGLVFLLILVFLKKIKAFF